MFRHARMGFSFGCRLVLHIVLLEPWWRWQLSSLQTLTVLCDVLKPSSAHICSRDLIYSRSLTHRLQPRLPRSHQDQRAIGSSESVILYWALEVCAAQRERKKERTSGGRLALTHLSALVLSHLSSRTSFLPIFFPFPPPPSPSSPISIPRFSTPTFILTFWPITLLSWDLTSLSSSLTFPSKMPSDVYEICVSFS